MPPAVLAFVASLVRHVLGIVVARVGLERDEKTLTDVSSWVATLVVAGVLALWSAWSRRRAEQAAAVKGARDVASVIPPAAPLLLLALAVAWSVLAGACATSESQQYKQASETYATALTALTPLIHLRVLPDQDVKAAVAIRQPAGELLDQWGEALRRGERFNAKDALRAMLAHLAALKTKTEGASP